MSIAYSTVYNQRRNCITIIVGVYIKWNSLQGGAVLPTFIALVVYDLSLCIKWLIQTLK